MTKLFLTKIKEAVFSVLPIVLIVAVLSFLPPFAISTTERLTFIICSIFLILGIALFTMGADLSMSEIGDKIGSSLVKTKKLWIIVGVCFVMGVLITVAEPDLSVLAEQVKAVFGSKITLIIFVGVGVGAFLALAVVKIIFKADLSFLLFYFYLILFALAALNIDSGKNVLVPLAFDSGGVTTGPITVPFLMALGVGISLTAGGRNYKENSFGIVALCSVGPIIAVMLLSLNASSALPSVTTDYALHGNIFDSVLKFFLNNLEEVAVSVSLIFAVFIVLDLVFIKLSAAKLRQITVGAIFTLFGIVLFLTAVQIGFMPMGYHLGYAMTKLGEPFVIAFGFIVGAVVVIAEPAVSVLTKQVEDITTGGVSKRSMLIALSVGVGAAMGLSIIRVVAEFSILYFIVPGYILSLGLSFFVPKIYTAIAFDSGGVASGPLTSSFILPFAVGSCVALHGESEVLSLAFGIVAVVALAPLIAVQLLGFKDVLSKRFRRRNRVKKLAEAQDGLIIDFER